MQFNFRPIVQLGFVVLFLSLSFCILEVLKSRTHSRKMPRKLSGAFLLTSGDIQITHEFKEERNTEFYRKFQINGEILSMGQFIKLMEEGNEVFFQYFIKLLRNSQWDAFYWECPPVKDSSSLKEPFEFVLVNSGYLARTTEADTSFFQFFKEEYTRKGAGVSGVSNFLNLGKDAMLVVPYPPEKQLAEFESLSKFVHLAKFVRNSSDADVKNLLHRVGQQVSDRVAQKYLPLWLSTAGEGVYWVHVRLDSYPKYYKHMPYKNV